MCKRHSHAELGQSAAVLFSVAFLRRRASTRYRAGRLEQGLGDVEHVHDVGRSTPRAPTGKSPRSHRRRWRRESTSMVSLRGRQARSRSHGGMDRDRVRI